MPEMTEKEKSQAFSCEFIKVGFTPPWPPAWRAGPRPGRPPPPRWPSFGRDGALRSMRDSAGTTRIRPAGRTSPPARLPCGAARSGGRGSWRCVRRGSGELPVDPLLAGFPLEFFRHARTLDISSTEKRFRKRKYFIIEPRYFDNQYAGFFLMLRRP